MITTVMFDLDGTLLPFVQEEFIKLYFGSLGNLAAGYGYDKQKFVKDFMPLQKPELATVIFGITIHPLEKLELVKVSCTLKIIS